jgi:hypothetical protein
MNRGAWEVWFYLPSGNRKLIDRFHRRNEAECYKAKLGRLIGKPSLVTICFDPNEEAPPNF